MEVLRNVLIKESIGTDKVFIIDNLPKELIYRKALKMMVDYTNPQQNLVPAFEMDEKGRKIPTREQVDELLPGIEKSHNEENCFVFFTDLNEAKERLASIDRYLEASLPQLERIPVRVNYAAQRGLSNSQPIPYSSIPRVVLPELVSPPVLATAQVPAPRDISVPQDPQNQQVQTSAQKEAARERMAKARAARKPKVA